MPSIRSCRSHFTNCPRPTVATNASTRHVQILGLPARSRCCSAARSTVSTPVDTAQTQLALPCSNTTCAKLMDRPPKSDTLRPGRTGPIACWCPVNSRASQRKLGESASAREHRTFERRCARCGQNRLIAPYGCGLCNPGGSNRTIDSDRHSQIADCGNHLCKSL